MVKIRLKRIGKRKQPYYRIVVTDSRRSRDGKYIESVGHYNPRNKNLIFNKERVEYWLSQGAQASNTAERLWKRYLNQNISTTSLSVSDNDKTVKTDSAESVANRKNE
ncbi:MAG: 30S ribosomal protein S16 [candidate division WOR-3 bacterium]